MKTNTLRAATVSIRGFEGTRSRLRGTRSKLWVFYAILVLSYWGQESPCREQELVLHDIVLILLRLVVLSNKALVVCQG